ncbi:MAG: fumarylacetoacetate hydrolase family protein [Parvibaculales bacterium]
MKLIRFGQKGKEQPGLLDKDGNIRSLSEYVDDIHGPSLSPSEIAKLQKIAPDSLPLIAKDTRIGACVSNVGKLICIGLNFADHAKETGADIPLEPVVFMKASSAISGPNDDILIPRNSEKTDWEVELAFVIGIKAKYVSETEAEQHIAGYFICHDVSERAFQLERGGQWDKGKCCDSFGPIGPYILTRDEMGDVSNLNMWLEVNGKRYQDGNTKTMIFKPAFIVSYLSHFMSLHPGDIVTTGTPPGVGLGQNPPIFLKSGDVVELGIEGLGSQRQNVKADS